MIYETGKIAKHIEHQLKCLFNLDVCVDKYMNNTIQRMDKCMEYSMQKPIRNGQAVFSVFHTSLYAIFLYQLSKVMLGIDGHDQKAEKIYCLNKVLHSVDWFYEIELPMIFGVEHPVGSVMGRAKYNDGFFFCQGCTVGGNNNHYPILGKNVRMCSDSKILGKSIIGNDIIISANTYIIDETIPDCSIVFGSGRNLTIVRKPCSVIRAKLDDVWEEEYLIRELY